MVQNSCVVILEGADTDKKKFSGTEDKLLLFLILQSFMVFISTMYKKPKKKNNHSIRGVHMLTVDVLAVCVYNERKKMAGGS